MPYKECVFNRKKGLVTIPGNYWRPNVTIPIEKVIFIKSSPSAQGINSHQLQIASRATASL